MIVQNIPLEHEAPREGRDLTLGKSLLDKHSVIREIRCLQISTPRYVTFVVLSVIFCGVPLLLYKWFLCVQLLIYREASPNSTASTHVLVKTKDSDWEICALTHTLLSDQSLLSVLPPDLHPFSIVVDVPLRALRLHQPVK